MASFCSRPAQNHHTAVDTSATRKHKRTKRSLGSTSGKTWVPARLGWFRKPLESTHYLMTQSLKQCKIFQIQLHIKCSSTDLIPQRRGSFHISLIKVYFHNAREVSPQTLQSLRFYSKDFKKAYKYRVMIKNSVGFLKNLNYLKLWKW